MKLPEPLFLFINPIVRFLLRSPIHKFWSGSLMLITFTGRKSNRRITTPVRYLISGGIVRCFSTSKGLWWRNLRGGAEVELRIRGENKHYNAIAIEHDAQKIRAELQFYLELFPQDASYHEIRLNRDNSLVEEDLDQACKNSDLVEARPVPKESMASTPNRPFNKADPNKLHLLD